MITGTVKEFHREHFTVVLDESKREVTANPRVWEAETGRRERLKRSLEGYLVFANPVAVGDRVRLAEEQPGHYVIEEVEGRTTWLVRKGTRRYAKQPQLVVANAERLAVVVSPEPRIKLAVIDRYFLAALQGGLEPLLIVNKLDLDEGLSDSPQFDPYRELGYSVLFTSAQRGDGISELAGMLDGRLTAFCGQSGVGKSSLLTLLTGQEIRTGLVKPRGTGRQTTTTARLYQLPGGGGAIDTPGIRVFGLTRLQSSDMRDFFADISRLAVRCRYNDCTHTVEPQCAVREAVEQGKLDAERVASYVKLREECISESYWERVWN